MWTELPPVKDHRMYDWAGVKYTCVKRRGQLLRDPPKWQLRGIEAAETFTDVFFLDRVERTEAADGDAADVEAVEYFKDFQLRARDGQLNRSDWDYISKHMDRTKRGDAFSGAEVFKLVTRRRDRDRLNLEELEAAIAKGTPAVKLDACNSHRVAADAHDDEIGLPSELVLTVDARVMITHNLCVDLGLCNGTVGKVHDILCNEKGEAIAILVRVRRKTATQDGYSGPSFLAVADGVDMQQEAIVAIPRWTAEIWDSGQLHTRSQFPLMLAWACTIHKVSLQSTVHPCVPLLTCPSPLLAVARLDTESSPH